jgi:hypothetical protein
VSCPAWWRAPGKAAYLDLDADPDLEFSYFLALQLGIGTVGEMQERMTNAEFVVWSRYFAREGQKRQVGL